MALIGARLRLTSLTLEQEEELSLFMSENGITLPENLGDKVRYAALEALHRILDEIRDKTVQEIIDFSDSPELIGNISILRISGVEGEWFNVLEEKFSEYNFLYGTSLNALQNNIETRMNNRLISVQHEKIIGAWKIVDEADRNRKRLLDAVKKNNEAKKRLGDPDMILVSSEAKVATPQ